MDPTEFLNALPGITVQEKIGEGQFSDVFRAKVYGEIRAIKVGKPLQEDSQFSISSLFEAQFRVQERIDGHGSVRVYHLEDHPQHPYIVMQYLPGIHLGAWLESHPKPSFQVCKSIILGIIHSLNFAHSAEIYHLDLKPSNIILNSNSFNEQQPCPVCLFDFSTKLRFKNDQLHLSSLLTSAPGLTTPLYTAPEVWHNKDIGPWSDIYSIGIVLAELFGNDPAVKSFELKLPSDAPRDIQTIIHKCLKPDIKERYQNLGELQRALLNCVQDTPKDLLIDGIIEEVQWIKAGEGSSERLDDFLSHIEQSLSVVSAAGVSLSFVGQGKDAAAAVIESVADGIKSARKLLRDDSEFSKADEAQVQKSYRSLLDKVSHLAEVVSQSPGELLAGRSKGAVVEAIWSLPSALEQSLTEAVTQRFDKALAKTRRKTGFLKKRMTWVFGQDKNLARLNEIKTALLQFFEANTHPSLQTPVAVPRADEASLKDQPDALRARWFEQPFIGYLRSFIETGAREHLPKTKDGKLDFRYAPFQSNNFSHHQIWHNISFEGATLNGVADSLYLIDCDFSHGNLKLKARELKILRSQFRKTKAQFQLSLAKAWVGTPVHSTEEPMNLQLLEGEDYFGKSYGAGDFVALQSQFQSGEILVESPAFQSSALLKSCQFNDSKLSFAGHSDQPRDLRVERCELIRCQLTLASRHTWLFHSSDLRRMTVESEASQRASLQFNENNNCQAMTLKECPFFVNESTNIDCRCTSWAQQEVPPTVQRLPCDHD